MIHESRIRILNDKPITARQYVLYWMQASQRTRFNHALEYAIQQANTLHQPLLVCFGLMDDYPEANVRHYAFMLEGLRDVHASLKKRGVVFIIKRGQPEQVAIHFAKNASLVICDRGYLQHQKRWYDHVADNASCRVVQIESDIVVPVETASDHAEFAARTLRPKIHRHWHTYLHKLPATPLKHKLGHIKIRGDIDIGDPQAALRTLKLDRCIPLSPRFKGGEVAARKLLDQFLKEKLPTYSSRRNEPSALATSTMSPYLHFGQISPVEIALGVGSADHAPLSDRDAYLEELIVRRELAINFVHFHPEYDTYDCLPDWAKRTLAQHRHDNRPYTYTREQLETATTHDIYWNAAQQEMTRTGYMQNYMRMYWGKKILEWKPSPEEAYADILHLNNKYFLDGRDPNAYANVAWIFGLHDRPWGPSRPIFGLIRYMNSAGLDRKFDMDAYVEMVNRLA